MRRLRPLPVVSLLVLSLSTTAFALAGSARTWTASISGKGGTAIGGSATMKPSADGAGTVVEVKLTNDAAGVTRPWHVHIGSCAQGGGVFGGGASYTPIAIGSGGEGTSTATLAVATPDSGSYYVNIHDSAANMRNIVACGDLTAE